MGTKTNVARNKSEIVRRLPRACGDERAAVEFLEELRWGDDPACPECGDLNVYQMCHKSGKRCKWRWRCRGCKKQFTVRTGTVMAESRIPLRIWCHAFWAACASKKGVSALQIQRQTGLTYKSALFLMHRVRKAMERKDFAALSGTVEADETYVGGKPRWKGTSKPGRGTKKVPVFAMVERGGDVHFKVMKRITSLDLGRELLRHANPLVTRLITDDFPAYQIAGRMFDGGHETVRHKYREYHRPGTDIHSNTVESVFSLLKRGLIGTFHSVSRKHLHRYCAEFEFRWNWRHVDDGERVRQAIHGADGKRLTYRPNGNRTDFQA